MERFYERWNPRNAGEALGLPCEDVASSLWAVPPFGAVLPWVNLGPHDAVRLRAIETRHENKSFGLDAGIEEGSIDFGPLSSRKADLEYMRLTAVADSINKNGYVCVGDMPDHISGYLLVKNSCYVVFIRGGQHRIAALSALEWNHVPILVGRESVQWPSFYVHREDVASWPNVKNGIFCEKTAIDVFDRIFNGKQPAGCQQ